MTSYFAVINEKVKQGRCEPEKGAVYTTRQILADLALADTPHFNLNTRFGPSSVQTSHMSEEQQLEWANGAAKGILWQYIRTTHEWCPIFRMIGTTDASQFCDVEEAIGFDGRVEEGAWVVPKGFPREQYYKRVAGEG